ncbi:unnamed protein product [Linum tenue]|uniref:Beta-glucosidase 11 n=1 Tax=Linum tenue TaxID=586396 RepID=A0AAV0I8U4_9ROSI|nr:unnamed protein product [Linum tenue]
MASGGWVWLLCLMAFLLSRAAAEGVSLTAEEEYSRGDFPEGFVFGAGTSAYQVEGAADQDGRSASVWDTFVQEGYAGGATGDVAVDQYHKYKDDVLLMAGIGLDSYRFSISWSRLIPGGRGAVNPKGVQYYNNLINELISHGGQSFFQGDFRDYAEVCFREFGDRVGHWTTVNEPNIFASGSYGQGLGPPHRCSPPFGVTTCAQGNSTTEPYLVLHNILLAHGSTVELYRENYQRKQGGLIGLTLFAFGVVPYTNSAADVAAAKRAKDFFIGWAVNPLVFGDYPEVMKRNVGSRLPSFTSGESKLVKGAFDFLGVIHYMEMPMKDNPESLDSELRDFYADVGAQMMVSLDSYTHGVSPSITYNFLLVNFPVKPGALREVLEDFRTLYGNPPLYVHENGKPKQSPSYLFSPRTGFANRFDAGQVERRNGSLKDTGRVEYLHRYIGAVLDAIRDGCNVRGYFVWSLMDVLELLGGFQTGYGLYYVDLDDPDLTRYPKLSAHWFSRFLNGASVGPDYSNVIVEFELAVADLSHLITHVRRRRQHSSH